MEQDILTVHSVLAFDSHPEQNRHTPAQRESHDASFMEHIMERLEQDIKYCDLEEQESNNLQPFFNLKPLMRSLCNPEPH